VLIATCAVASLLDEVVFHVEHLDLGTAHD
jgi:hypothetical protein